MTLSSVLISFVMLVVSWIATLVITPLCGKLAVRSEILDYPGGRKVHAAPIPLLGGLSIFLSMAISFGVLYVWRHEFWDPRFFALSIVVACAVVLGFIDDVLGIKPVVKLAFEAMLGLALYYIGFGVHAVTSPVRAFVEVGPYWGPLVTVVWTCVVINAINIIDGLDGLASGVVVIASMFLMAISLVTKAVGGAMLFGIIAGANAGFLFYNFYPAKIFLGDMGTILIGTLLAAATMAGYAKQSAATALMIPIVALFLPIGDGILSIVRRARNGRSWFRADVGHIHHRLVSIGLSQRTVVLVVYALSVCLGLFALLLSKIPSLTLSLLIMAVLAIFTVLFMLALQWIEDRIDPNRK
ncbi:MAG: undecaprenyl/decaprenyl-phosphate alpha-N-acetylglucosaminyl 1-phosphate transferase [Candidatus Hydrogenedentes bacterium]|nr:undecaprenyl/decaprenyl-phosphate alpha-N-acetylglucosaminyl 1-phosphate transferase [Candidatus Hydrogenedentota bacterium]